MTTLGDIGTAQLNPDQAALDSAERVAKSVLANVGDVILGKKEVVALAVTAMISGSHLLIEDVPGVGKTRLAEALARSVGGTFRRIQGTSDLLPADLTGVNVYKPDTGSWEFRPGPIFANVVLVDEVNRANPRTQSALLEAMEEGRVTVDGVTHLLPQPFFVVATQNPDEFVGTFPLVEGQRDRFGIVCRIGYPSAAAESDLLLGSGGAAALDALKPVASPDELSRTITAVAQVHCERSVANYVVSIVNETRGDPRVALGASPRAALSLLAAGKAHALLSSRGFVTPDDIKAVATASLAHRVLVSGARASLSGAEAFVAEIVSKVPVPRP